MFKEAFVLFLLLIVGDRIGSLTGTPTPVSQNQQENTRAELYYLPFLLRNLKEAVQNMSERFKEQLDRIEQNQIAFKQNNLRESVQNSYSLAGETSDFTSKEPNKFFMPPFIMPDRGNRSIQQTYDHKPIRIRF